MNATHRAWERLAAARPRLAGLCPLGQAVPVPERTLLHAGPPLPTGARPCAPMLNSAVQAVLFEGWADDAREARRLILDGAVRLASAQDHGCVVPLASVLSPGQQVQIVHAVAERMPAICAPLNGGSGPALRLGLPGPEVLAHLRWLNGPFADALRPVLREGLDLLPIADAALLAGDDCHGRTAAGTLALAERLQARGLSATGAAAGFLSRSPSFFLNLWMAAAKAMLAQAEGEPGATLLTAFGGNGIETGIQIAALPGRWFTAPAQPPAGRLDPGRDAADSLPAIGDSAVVEALGMGALAMHHAPQQLAALEAFMPVAAPVMAETLLLGPHPALRSGVRVGLSVHRVATQGLTPAVALGILDRHGRHGRIGGGIWQAPAAPFHAAIEALSSSHLP